MNGPKGYANPWGRLTSYLRCGIRASRSAALPGSRRGPPTAVAFSLDAVMLTAVQCGAVCRSEAKHLFSAKRDPSLTLRVTNPCILAAQSDFATAVLLDLSGLPLHTCFFARLVYNQRYTGPCPVPIDRWAVPNQIQNASNANPPGSSAARWGWRSIWARRIRCVAPKAGATHRIQVSPHK